MYRLIPGVVVAAILLIVVGIIFATSTANVDAGQVGVVSHWGAIDVNEQPYQPGFHWITPFSGVNVQKVSVQQQAHPFKEVSTASRELQNVFVDGQINYHISSNEAAGITINGGVEAFVTRVFNPAFQDYIKETVPQYSTTDQFDSTGKLVSPGVLTARPLIRAAVLKRLQEKAAHPSDDPKLNYHVFVDDVLITDIHFDKTYSDAIEKKQVSQQQLEQAKIDAQKVVASANGERDASIAKAQGSAQATLLQAQAQAEANRLLEAQLSRDLIEYTVAQRWNGVLPIYSPGSGSGAIINIPAPAATPASK